MFGVTAERSFQSVDCGAGEDFLMRSAGMYVNDFFADDLSKWGLNLFVFTHQGGQSS
jgi:hypothetical protein